MADDIKGPCMNHMKKVISNWERLKLWDADQKSL